MNRRQFVIISSLLGLPRRLFAGRAAMPPGLHSVEPATDLPAFSLPGIDGSMVRSDDLKGSVLILRFWASWCTICKGEMPSVQKVYQAFKDTTVKVLTISIDVGGAKDVKPFLTQHGYTMPTLIDSKMEEFSKLGLVGIPGTLIVDRQGRIVAKNVGPVDFDNNAFKQYIDGLKNA